MTRALHAAAALVLAVAFGLAGVGSLLASTAGTPAPASTASQAVAPLEGIDISNWQGTIDWAAVAGAGKSFAIAKATEGETYKDPYYASNHANARAAGVRLGAYHFAQPGNPASEALIQADWFVQNANLLAGDVIPALDLEVTNGLSVADLQAWVLAFLQQVEYRTGAKAMIYVSPSFWSTRMGNTTMFADLGYNILWIAHWGVANPTVPAANWGGKGWTFWQYSNCGAVPGIAGCVDLDRYNGSDMTPVLFGPGVPTAVTGVPGSQQVTVSWAAPVASSGGPLTGYTVTASPGGRTCSSTGATTCTVTGLANGTAYTFTVTGTNGSGTGQPSAASAGVTPRTVPDAPTGVAATPGNQQAQVSWTAPAWNGGAAITGYTVTSSPEGRTCTTAGATLCTVTGLANGTAYTFTVTATNVAGAGAPSGATTAVTPRTVPDAPTGATALPGDAFAAVSWAAPAWNGGMPITGYTVTAAPGGKTCTTSGALTCSVLGLTNGTPYTFTVKATSAGGTSAASASTATTTPWAPVASTYYPVAPVRILDTRIGTGLAGAFQAGVARTVVVGGAGGIPANATAVTGNLTVTGQTAGGWVTLGPAVEGIGHVSTLNFPAGDDRANNVTIPLAPGGLVSAAYAGPAGAATQLILDITGYFLADSGGATFKPLAPARILDTRFATGLSGAFVASSPRTLQVTGAGGVPAGAVAVTGNLTVTGQSARGWLTLGPSAAGTGGFSTLNFPAGDTRANGLAVRLAADGSLAIALSSPVGGTAAHVILDVTGYFVADASGAKFVPLAPARVLDTRAGNGLAGTFVAGVPRTFMVEGRGGVPGTAVAVTGNLTTTGHTSTGAVALGPVAAAVPATSTLNAAAGDTRANGVTVALAGDGTLAGTYFVAPAASITHLIFDVTGYFVP